VNIFFQNPWFLYLLPAAAIPILLHLISRDFPQKVVFPTIRFLMIGRVPTHEKRRLRNIFLMILRMVILSLFILGFAFPFLNRNNPVSVGARTTVILVDISVGLHRDGALERVRQEVEKILDNSPSTEQFKIILSAHENLKESPLTASRAQLRSFIRKIQPVYSSPSHAPTLSKAANFLNGKNNPRLIIVSDFSRTGFEHVQRNSFSKNTEIELVDYYRPVSNISIIGSIINCSGDGEIRKVRAMVKLKNTADSVQNIQVNMIADKKIDSKMVSLKPGLVQSALLTGRIRGGSPVRFTITDDGFQPDNVYFSWIPFVYSLNALLITGEIKNIYQKNEIIFLKEALGLYDKNLGRVNVSHIFAGKLTPQSLEKASIIFLLGSAGEISRENFDKIYENLLKGLLIVCTPGENFSRNFSMLIRNGLIGQTARNQVGGYQNREPSFVEEITFDNEIMKIFEGKGDSDIYHFPIYKYIRTHSRKNSGILMKNDEGDPLVYENHVGKGACYLFTFSLDNRWSELPFSTSFVPLIRQIINQVKKTSRIPESQNAFPGQTRKVNTLSPIAHLYDKTGDNLMIALEKGSRLPMQNPGVYILDESPLIVNVDRKQSLPEKINLYELKEQLRKKKTSEESRRQVLKKSRDSLWWLYLILIGICALYLESIYNTRIPRSAEAG